MRFIITAQPGPNGTPPDPDAPFDEALFTAYMKFNEDMHKAGALVPRPDSGSTMSWRCGP